MNCALFEKKNRENLINKSNGKIRNKNTNKNSKLQKRMKKKFNYSNNLAFDFNKNILIFSLFNCPFL